MGHPDDAAHDPLPRGHTHGAPVALRHARRQAGRAQGDRFDLSISLRGQIGMLRAFFGFPVMHAFVCSSSLAKSGDRLCATRRSLAEKRFVQSLLRAYS